MSQYGTENPLLDARLHGAGVFTATNSSTTSHEYLFTFDCKFNGIEIITDSNVEIGDYLRLETQYNAGAYGWKRYKKFGDKWYIKPNDRSRIILFPTEPSSGVKLLINYTSVGTSDVKFAFNLFTFVDQVKLDTGILEEGEDW